MKRSIILLCIALAGCKEETQPEKVQQIDQEIQDFEKKSMEDEVHSLGAFRANYSKFAKELEKSEASEEHVRELEKEKEAILHPK